jgi:phenylalanyl-tRNA synthetase beta chain
MLVSLEWLREYVDFALTPMELAEKLTMVGLEVAEMTTRSAKGLDKVVVGKIVSRKQHPNADKLSLCEVDIGTGENLSIVCGAPNSREGMLSSLALVGAELPSGIKIEPVTVRGVTSHGMLCSEKELNIGSDASGIMDLPAEFKPGTPLAEALGLDDIIMNIELTPNRSDCLSIFGIAREVSAITGNPLKKPKIEFQESSTQASSLTSVTINDPDLCPRYAARLVLGVKIGPSPYWMRRRLESMGLRSISNVVDVTNYVLMELGHPLHAFDFDNLNEKRIIVRRAKLGEKMTTLDEQERELDNDMLVIADAKGAVAVAGVMGGSGSDVTENSTNILIESAYFDPVSISKTSKALGMHTEASHRFERGTDIEGLITALNRTTQLIQQLGGGEICAGIVDTYPAPREKIVVKLRPERANSVLGTDLNIDEMQKILTGLEFQTVKDESNISVTVPTFRPDVNREIDLIEEIARLYGYNNIPVTMPASEVPPESDAENLTRMKYSFRSKLRNILTACGLMEVLNYSFHGSEVYDMLKLEDDCTYRNTLRLRNPLSENQSVVRTTLLPVLLENIKYNMNRRINDIRIFEIGRVFHPKAEGKQPNEPEFVSGAITGFIGAQEWNLSTRQVDFYDIKGIIESILDEIGIRDYQLKATSTPPFQPGRSAEIMAGDKSLGVFGELRRDVLNNCDIEQNIYMFEMDFGELMAHSTFSTYEPLPTLPSVYRDMAIVLNYDILSSQVEEAIKIAGGELIKNLSLFDVYKGKQIADNKKSLAYSIEYYSPKQTLTDEEVDEVHQKIVSALAEKFGAELRK